MLQILLGVNPVLVLASVKVFAMHVTLSVADGHAYAVLAIVPFLRVLLESQCILQFRALLIDESEHLLKALNILLQLCDFLCRITASLALLGLNLHLQLAHLLLKPSPLALKPGLQTVSLRLKPLF